MFIKEWKNGASEVSRANLRSLGVTTSLYRRKSFHVFNSITAQIRPQISPGGLAYIATRLADRYRAWAETERLAVSADRNHHLPSLRQKCSYGSGRKALGLGLTGGKQPSIKPPKFLLLHQSFNWHRAAAYARARRASRLICMPLLTKEGQKNKWRVPFISIFIPVRWNKKKKKRILVL